MQKEYQMYKGVKAWSLTRIIMLEKGAELAKNKQEVHECLIISIYKIILRKHLKLSDGSFIC